MTTVHTIVIHSYITLYTARIKLLDGDRLRFQSIGVRRGFIGCYDDICDLRFCPSWNENNLRDFSLCWAEVFQIIGEGLHLGGPITSGMRVRIRYTRVANTWFACVNNARCDKRPCPGNITQARNFDVCGGEVFHIYARGREFGEDIANGDLVMLFSSFIDRRYVAANGQNDADDLTVDFCPGETPPAYLSYAFCSKNVFRIYIDPSVVQ